MAEENRFESRLARRGGRIIDVEGSISQDPAISAQDGESAPYTSVNPLPSGEDTAPYMPIAPIAPDEPPQPPAPDQYESWPPTMISLAEGAPVNAIAGRPIHELTGIQPGNINPNETAAPSTPEITIGFDSAFKNAVDGRPLLGLSPKLWESGLGTTFGPEASDGVSTIGRLPGGARLAPHPGEEQGGSEIGGSTPGRGIVIDDDKRTAPPPKPGPGDEPPPGEKPCDCLLLVDYQEFPPQHGRQKGRRKEGYSDISVQPGSVFFLRFELFDGSEVKKPWNIAWFKHTPAGRAPGPEKSLVFYEGTNAGRMAADNNRPSKGLTSGYTPCPSTITRWVRANEEGKYEIVFIWGNLRCSVKIWVRYDYALGVPQECGCSILCYDLDIKGMPEVDMDPAKQVASANCQIKVDSTDSLNGPNNFGSANFGFTQVLGILRLTGNDITDKKYHWTLDCEGDYLEFTRDIRLDPHTLKAAPADDAEFKCHDEGDDICGTPIPFIVRPTQKALDEFLTGRRFPLVDKIIGVVGKQRCPIRIVISNFCDKDLLGKYIDETREPAEVKFAEATGQLGAALWEPKQGLRTEGDQSFSSVQNGEISVYERGKAADPYTRYLIDVELSAKLTLDFKWSPPDCCCVFIVNANVGMKVTVRLDQRWYVWKTESERNDFAVELTKGIFSYYEDESPGGFRDSIRQLANEQATCRKATRADCADVADIESQWTTNFLNATSSLLFSRLPKGSVRPYKGLSTHTLVDVRLKKRVGFGELFLFSAEYGDPTGTAVGIDLVAPFNLPAMKALLSNILGSDKRIRVLEIVSHGSPHGIALSAKEAPGGPSANNLQPTTDITSRMPLETFDTYLKIGTDAITALTFGELMRPFMAEGGEIWLNACALGLGPIPDMIADKSGCRVAAPMAFCSQGTPFYRIIENPEGTISKYTREFIPWPKKKTYEGAAIQVYWAEPDPYRTTYRASATEVED